MWLAQKAKIMTQLINRQICLKSRPEGTPVQDNFELIESPTTEPANGEILVRNEWMSVDPYMRGRMRESKSYVPAFEIGKPLEGGCIGRVVQSKCEGFVEGDYVLGNLGWRDLWTSTTENVRKIANGSVPIQSYLSVLGMTGMTAFVGLMRIAELKEGERVFISAASGAVGSIACQIAKIRNCYVVGSAGSEEKIEWLKNHAAIDAAINYHDCDDLPKRLAELFPEGIDVYFDNVGGDHLEAAIDNLRDFGRIVCCGMISGYNDETPQSGPPNLFKVIGKRLRLQGFIVRDHSCDQSEFARVMLQWIEAKRIHWEETVTEGLENAPKAFINLFSGDKMGKALVKI